MKINTVKIPSNTSRTILHNFLIIIAETLCSAYRFFLLMLIFLEDILSFLEDMPSTIPPIFKQKRYKLNRL